VLHLWPFRPGLHGASVVVSNRLRDRVRTTLKLPSSCATVEGAAVEWANEPLSLMNPTIVTVWMDAGKELKYFSSSFACSSAT